MAVIPNFMDLGLLKLARYKNVFFKGNVMRLEYFWFWPVESAEDTLKKPKWKCPEIIKNLQNAYFSTFLVYEFYPGNQK